MTVFQVEVYCINLYCTEILHNKKMSSLCFVDHLVYTHWALFNGHLNAAPAVVLWLLFLVTLHTPFNYDFSIRCFSQ